MKYTNYIVLIIFVFVAACTKTTQDIVTSIDIPIVESFLLPGDEILVRLTTAIPYSTDTTLEYNEDLSGMVVYISTDSGTYILNEIYDSAGYYKDMSGELEIKENITYNLEFQYKEQLISSSTTTPLVPENFETSESTIELGRITESSGMGMPPDMTEIELTWDDFNNDYYLLYIQYMEDEYDTVNTLFEIDDAYEMANFSSEPIQNNNYILRSRQFQFFGEYQIVLCRITEEYAQLYETLSQSSLEGLAEPPTNIINGKGIFTGFNSDTLTINVVED